MWELFDPDDVLSTLSQPERDLFGTGASDEDFPDRLIEIINEVVSMVRGRVAAWPDNRASMGPEETIPEELYLATINIVRYQLLTALPGGRMFIDEPRERTYSDALKLMENVAAGTLVVGVPGNIGFTSDQSRFGSRDDYLQSGKRNLNVQDYGFWH
jgi:phage gp36-like protein